MNINLKSQGFSSSPKYAADIIRLIFGTIWNPMLYFISLFFPLLFLPFSHLSPFSLFILHFFLSSQSSSCHLSSFCFTLKFMNVLWQVEWMKMFGDSENYLWKSLAEKQENRNARYVNGKKIKRNKKNRKWVSYFRQFFAESSLHGLHYLVRSEKTILER